MVSQSFIHFWQFLLDLNMAFDVQKRLNHWSQCDLMKCLNSHRSPARGDRRWPLGTKRIGSVGVNTILRTASVLLYWMWLRRHILLGGKVGLRLAIQIGMALAIDGLVEVMKNQKIKEQQIYIYIVLVFIKFPWREHRMDMPLHQSQWFLEIFCLCNFGGKKVASWFTPASGDSLYVGRRSQRWSCIGCRRFGCGHCQWLATALWRSSVSTETLMTSGFNEGWLYNLHSMIHDSVWRCGCLCFCFLPMQITTDEIWWNEGENSLGFLKWIGTVALKDVVIGSGGAMLMRFVQALHFAKRCKAGPAVWLHFLRAIPWYTYTAYTCIWGPIWRMLTDMDPWHFADFSGAYPTKPDFCRDLNLLDFFWSTWPTCWWSELQTTGMSFSWSDTVAMWPSFFMYCRF